jgi:uncharacterized protein GlcG (DUF336 family)
MRAKSVLAAAVSAVVALGLAAGAQAQNKSDLPAGVPEAMPFNVPYGQPISLELARRVVAAALAESSKHHWKEACAVVEGNGQLVLFEKQDDTQYGSVNVALDKAKSAALYRRPTTVFNEATKHGGVYVMQLAGSTAVPGGLPVVENGKLIGGLGCSGGTGDQDIVVAKAGLEVLAKH